MVEYICLSSRKTHHDHNPLDRASREVSVSGGRGNDSSSKSSWESYCKVEVVVKRQVGLGLGVNLEFDTKTQSKLSCKKILFV